MSLEFKSTERFLKQDARYKNKTVSKFINSIMKRGKKSTAEKIFYNAMEVIAKKTPEKEPLEIFETALNNIKPLVEVKSRRIGGATYQVPIEVPRKRQMALAMRWMLESAKAKKTRPMFQRLAEEISDAFKRQGGAFTKRENTHKMAEANKAFAHFTW